MWRLAPLIEAGRPSAVDVRELHGVVLHEFMGSGYPLEVTAPMHGRSISMLGFERSAVWSLLWWAARHS
jgi:hypothetical protein